MNIPKKPGVDLSSLKERLAKKVDTTPQLFLYLLTQSDCKGWNTIKSIVVAAFTEDEAKKIHPLSINKDGKANSINWWKAGWDYELQCGIHGWAKHPENVKCLKIGIADFNVVPGSILIKESNKD